MYSHLYPFYLDESAHCIRFHYSKAASPESSVVVKLSCCPLIFFPSDQYASWDSAFHMLPFCKVDPEFAKDQLLMFLRETYMAPNGQIPAYEFALSDVNPPVHALACYRVYELTGRSGKKDTVFLAKLLLNFTW